MVCTAQCVVGCQCPAGTVLDEVEQKCVSLDQCGMSVDHMIITLDHMIIIITIECPPTCSHQFCSNHGNKYKPCSR